MPTISDLFKNQKKELYGTSDMIRIESKGLINPPRGAALLLSTPNSIGDLIGNQLAGAVGGSANRPDDTIFKDKAFLSKPISLFKTQAGLRDAVKAGEEYFIKQTPAGDSLLGKMKEGASSPIGVVAAVGIDLIQGLKKKNPTKGNPYGSKFQTDEFGKTLEETKTFSGFYEKYEYKQLSGTSKGPKSWVVTDIEKREIEQSATWDGQNNMANSVESYWIDYQDELFNDTGITNQVWVLFKKLGNKEIIPFTGTITGLSEDVSPEWTNFRYLGSPFKTYRYQGVERSLKFELKLYYTTPLQKDTMIRKINYLKSLAFPYEQISEIQYNRNQENPIDTPTYSQYAFSPNLVSLSIGDMYKNMFGFIETLSFSIDDNTTWPNENFNMTKTDDNSLYPSVVSVSISFKIIENHKTVQKNGITKYKYNFDGLYMNVNETQETKQQKAPEIPNIQSSQTTTNNKISDDTSTVATKKKKKKKPIKNILTDPSAGYGTSLTTNTGAGTYQPTTNLINANYFSSDTRRHGATGGW